jgi:hypothetical protein
MRRRREWRYCSLPDRDCVDVGSVRYSDNLERYEVANSFGCKGKTSCALGEPSVRVVGPGPEVPECPRPTCASIGGDRCENPPSIGVCCENGPRTSDCLHCCGGSIGFGCTGTLGVDGGKATGDTTSSATSAGTGGSGTVTTSVGAGGNPPSSSAGPGGGWGFTSSSGVGAGGPTQCLAKAESKKCVEIAAECYWSGYICDKGTGDCAGSGTPTLDCQQCCAQQ